MSLPIVSLNRILEASTVPVADKTFGVINFEKIGFILSFELI